MPRWRGSDPASPGAGLTAARRSGFREHITGPRRRLQRSGGQTPLGQARQQGRPRRQRLIVEVERGMMQ
jgi:hypothetical protein